MGRPRISGGEGREWLALASRQEKAYRGFGISKELRSIGLRRRDGD